MTRKVVAAIETPMDITIAKIATIKIARIAMIAMIAMIMMITKIATIATIAKIAKIIITKATINASLARTSVEVERRVAVARVDKTA